MINLRKKWVIHILKYQTYRESLKGENVQYNVHKIRFKNINIFDWNKLKY